MRVFPQQESTWLKSAIIFFFIAAFLGALLRFAFVFEMPDWLKYKNVQHAHSHVAMMGWLTAAFYVFICKYFQLNRAIYKYVFWTSQVVVLGMLFSFMIQGYAFFSIFFSSAYMLLSYLFIFAVLKDVRKRNSYNDYSSLLFLKTSLVFLGLSTLGIWAMGPIMSYSMRGSALYYASVQFYLHFQFNGWFIFALLALMFKIFESKKIVLNRVWTLRFYWFLFLSCFLTYALSVTWSTPENLLFWANSIGVLMQGVGLIFFLKILNSINSPAKEKLDKRLYVFWGIAFLCLSLKILMQSFVAIPHLAKMSYTIHNFVIGFIHLLMLGALSTFLFGLIHNAGFQVKKIGVQIFLLGFVLSETLLFGQGILIWAGLGFIPNYYLLLAMVSTLLPIGVITILINFKKLNSQ